MSSLEDKLEVFRGTVFQDAEKQRDEILKRAAERKTELLAERENEFLTEAYRQIQKEISRLERNQNEAVSKALSKCKRDLLMERKKVVSEIFYQVEQKIYAYKKTEAYPTYLQNAVADGIKKVGEGEILVFLDKSDRDFLPVIEQKFQVKAELDEIKIIGGAKIHNKTKNIVCDNTIIDRLEEEKVHFLEEAGLSVTL